MWPLLALSVASVAISLERVLFWTTTHGAKRMGRVRGITRLVREGDLPKAAAKAARDRTVYGQFLGTLIARAQEPVWGGAAITESFAHEEAERIRPVIERFHTSMATIITAAPMLGILGTVTGIISSFRLIGGSGPLTDPTRIASGIGEALFTTAFGLIVALVTLFPYAMFRAQAERCLSRLEVMAATVVEASRRPDRASPAPTPPRERADPVVNV